MSGLPRGLNHVVFLTEFWDGKQGTDALGFIVTLHARVFLQNNQPLLFIITVIKEIRKTLFSQTLNYRTTPPPTHTAH